MHMQKWIRFPWVSWPDLKCPCQTLFDAVMNEAFGEWSSESDSTHDHLHVNIHFLPTKNGVRVNCIRHELVNLMLRNNNNFQEKGVCDDSQGFMNASFGVAQWHRSVAAFFRLQALKSNADSSPLVFGRNFMVDCRHLMTFVGHL